MATTAYNASQALARANAARTNKPGMCQQATRGWYGARSAGDQDKDGDFDAKDGWLSEPLAMRHTDRNPPAGAPVYYSGGSHGHGHRAIADGKGGIRTTDGLGEGKMGNQKLNFPEKQWKMKYVGWSETIDGEVIPGLTTKALPKNSRGEHVDAAVESLRKARDKAKPGTARHDRLQGALDELNKIKPHTYK